MQKDILFEPKTCDFCTKLQKKQTNHIRFIIHPTMFILLFDSIVAGMFWLFLIYFVSIVYHEFAHAIISKKLGYKAEKIVLYPTGALLYGETDEFTFKDEILISLAGPIANLIVVVLFVFLWWIFPELYNYSSDIVVANLSLATFNLLPVFPLDGGRILLAILSTKFDRKTASKIARKIACVFSAVLFVIFVYSLFYFPNFQFGIMSIILFISSISEDKNLAIKRIAKTDIKRRKLVHGLKSVVLCFGIDATLKKIYDRIDNFAIYRIVIVNEQYAEIASFGEIDIENLCTSYPLSITIGKLIELRE